jgi:DNA-binding CsgD family transcriptional regulator
MSPEQSMLRLFDAAYTLEDCDTAGWLGRIVEALRWVFDSGRGCYAWTIVPSDRQSHRLGDFATLDFTPEQMAAVPSFHERASGKLLARAYGREPLVTVCETLGWDHYHRSPLVHELMFANRIPDCVGLRIRSGSTRLVLGGVVHEPGQKPEPVVRFARKLVAVLRPALRLHLTLRVSSERPTAMLEPSGRVVHAEGVAREPGAREQLAMAVRAHERRNGMKRKDPRAALELFDGLVAGRWTLVERFESDGRRYLIAYENSPEAAAIRALSPRERDVLVSSATGASLKSIAADLGISQGAAGAYLAAARRKTGSASRAELARWFAQAAKTYRER